MRTLIPFILITLGCAPEVTDDAAEVTAMLQSAVPGALTLDIGSVHAGSPAVVDVSGAAAGETVYVGLSEVGVEQASVCPSILQDCINLSTPVRLLGTATADANGEATLTVDVPDNAVYSSVFLQAAAWSGTSQVAHRFIQEPLSCPPGTPTIDCTVVHPVSGSWSCAQNESCQDVYDLYLEAGARLTVDHHALTGSSVSRVAVFGPGVPLSGTNLLWGSNYDVMCYGQDESQVYSLTAQTSGTYRIAVGRDWGSSSGNSGTYELDLTVEDALPPAPVQTVDDLPSEAAGPTCLI